MNERRGDPTAAISVSPGAPRCLGTLLAAGLAMAVVSGRAGAEDGSSIDLGSSGLRTGGGLDLSMEMRGEAERSIAAPDRTARDLSPAEPSASSRPAGAEQASETDAGPDDVPPETDEAPARPRPKIDLFEGPAPAARKVSPAGRVEPQTAQRPRRSQEADGPDAPARGGPDIAEATLRPGAALESGLSLPPAPVRGTRIGAVDSRSNLRIAPLRGLLPASPDDPFAPVGLRVGSFVLTSTLDQSLGLSSNVDRAPGGPGGAFSETVLSARFLSDWSRHAAEFNALAGYRRNFAGNEPSNPDLTLDGRLRFDLDRLTTAALKGGFTYRQEDAEDLDSVAGDGERPDILIGSASAEIERQIGAAFLRGTGTLARETTSDRAGATDDEDFTTYAAALRAGYRLTPAFTPFLEASHGRRIFDVSRNSLAQSRDSTIDALRGGLAFDFTEKLSGEIAAGYAWNRPDENDFAGTGAPTFDARIAWSPQRGTDVALTASTTFDPDASGSSTATLYEGGVALRHRATARLEMEAALTAGYRDSDVRSDVQRTFGASTGFTYWVNRSLAFIGLASHDRVERPNGTGDYDVDTVKIGLRLQN